MTEQTQASVAGTPARSRPTGERHLLVDALRGLALLGIVVVNVEFILEHADAGWSASVSTVDLGTRWAVTTFGQFKVYPLFALLFGYGLAVQLQHATERGTSLGARYLRRMVGLALMGVAHAVLFFPGDILVIYAVVGGIAFSLRRHGSGSLLRIAAWVYAAAAAVWLAVGLAFWSVGATVESPPRTEMVQVLATGDLGDVIGQHAAAWPGTLVVLALIQGPAALAFSLVGVALGRSDVLTHPDAYRRWAQRVLVTAGPIGLAIGGVGAVLTTRGEVLVALGLALGFLSAPLVSAAYLAVLLVFWSRLPRVLTSPLQAAGRMSLSVYLLESVVLSTLAYGYGFGLVGGLSPLACVLVAVGVWAVLCFVALAWLRFARFGPAEWVLRSFSAAKVQPLVDRPAIVARRGGSAGR